MKLFSGGVFRRPAPENLVEADKAAFEKDFVHESPDIGLVEHRDVVFAPGGEAFRGGEILPGYFPVGDQARRPPQSWYDSRLKHAAHDAVAYGGDYVWVTDRFSANYYHWLCDCLPRLEAYLAQHSHGRLLLPRAVWALPFVRQSLSAYPQIELVDPPPPGRGGRVERMFVPDAVAANGNHHEDLAGRVAARMTGAFAKGIKPSASVKLHVSRILARKRKLANEPVLAATFTRHGFKPVLMEKMEFAEQVRIAASAKAIAGVHGAGLANSLFMQPGNAVVELRQVNEQRNSFYTLAAARGHSYFYVPCTPANPNAAPQAGDVACQPGTLDSALMTVRARKGY
jgi:capsular polysaccharide biosynthesis protein